MNYKMLSDNELLEAYLSGEEAAIEIIIQRYKRKIYTYLYYRIRNKDVVADLFQETFIKAFKSVKDNKYSDYGKFSSYLMRIAHNLTVDYIRKQNKIPQVDLDNYDYDLLNYKKIADLPGESKIIKSETNADIRKLINYLPENQREVVIMRVFFDMSFKEIAEETNVSINTALGRMRYAILNLKRMIKEKKLLIEYCE